MFKNRVYEDVFSMVVILTKGKAALVDNDEYVKGILRTYKFHAIRRGENQYYALSTSTGTGRNYLHRLIVANLLSTMPGGYVLHEDGNPLNCKRENLFVRSSTCQMMRAVKLQLQSHDAVNIYQRINGWVVSFTEDGVRRKYQLFAPNDRESAEHFRLKKLWQQIIN